MNSQPRGAEGVGMMAAAQRGDRLRRADAALAAVRLFQHWRRLCPGMEVPGARVQWDDKVQLAWEAATAAANAIVPFDSTEGDS